MGAISDLLGDTWMLQKSPIFIGRATLKTHHIYSSDREIFMGHDHDRHRTVVTNHDHDASEDDTRRISTHLDAAIAIRQWTLDEGQMLLTIVAQLPRAITIVQLT